MERVEERQKRVKCRRNQEVRERSGGEGKNRHRRQGAGDIN